MAEIIKSGALNVPMRDFTTPEQFMVVRMKLDTVCMLITGKVMEEAHQLILVEWLRNEFKDFSASDIENAIRLYAAKKLNCDASMCTRMSAEYIGTILTAYREYKRNPPKPIRFHPERTLAENNPITDQQHFESILKHVDKYRELPDWGSNIYLPAYFHVDGKQMVFSNEEKEKFKKSFMDDLRQKEKYLRVQGGTVAQIQLSNIKDMFKNERYLKNTLRVEMFKMWMKKQHKL